MIDGQKVLAIIPARGGSKRIPRKNLALLGGKPLIAWTIEQARASRYIDRVVVSTEDAQIAAVAREYGGDVPFMRPADLATDGAPSSAFVLHAVEQLPGYEYIVLLQPTSPLRKPGDIESCIQACWDWVHPACISLSAGRRLEPDVGRLVALPEELHYAINGAVYVARANNLRANGGEFLMSYAIGYVMPASRSLDIDTPADLAEAELALA